jgi:hypothetical protein
MRERERNQHERKRVFQNWTNWERERELIIKTFIIKLKIIIILQCTSRERERKKKLI